MDEREGEAYGSNPTPPRWLESAGFGPAEVRRVGGGQPGAIFALFSAIARERQMEAQAPMRERSLEYHGVRGEDVAVESANPKNHYEAIQDPAGCEPIVLDGKLFLRSADGPAPVVVIVPGSLGVGPNHLAHAEALVGCGFGVLVVDPFVARSIQSTVANQVQYSFAASAFDVLAALRFLRARDDVDSSRISAQGHSRGGSAVTIAAMRRFADPIVGEDAAFAGVYAVYPWCGHQFVDPQIGTTRFRAIVGERDEWVSIQQVQAQAHAIRLAGGDASARIVAGAQHSFDRLEAVYTIEEAKVSPTAATAYLARDGAVIDPYSGEANPDLCDYDVFVAAARGGHARTGAAIGGASGEPELFREDMLAFHRSVLRRA